MKHSSTSPFLLFAALLYLACAVSSASAQETDLMDLNLEDLLKVEVVSSASRYEQSLSDAPSSVTIVTRKDIQTFGYRTMAELINGVRGFYVTNDTNYSHTGVRGFGRPSDFDTRLLVLLNGHRLNDSIYASSLFGLDFMIDIDLVEQVEIVRGPSSSVYGTNAFFGVINIVTRKPDDVGLEVSSDIEKHDTYQERVSYGESFENGIELLASFTRFDSHGQDFYFPEFDAPETNNGIANNLDGEDGYSAYLQLSFEDFTISSGMVDRNKDVPAAPFETLFNDPIFTTQDQRFFIDAKYSTQLSEGTQFETRLFYDWYEYRGYYPYDYAEEEDEDPFYVTNKDFSRGERIGAQANVILTSVENNKIVVGTEAREVFNIDQTNVDVDPAYTYLDSFENETIWALYAQDEITLTDWATLHVGLRFDDYESIDSEISPRAGLIFHPSDSSNLKFLYGQAFRAPNAFELYYNDAETQKAPQNLKPEKIDTWEFVYEQQLDKNVRFIFDTYYYEVDDLIDQVVDPADDLIVYVNTDKIDAYGIEAEIEARFSGGWLAKTSYTYQDAEVKDTGIDLSNSPNHLWKTHLSAPLYKDKLRGAAEILYVSSRDNLNGVNVNDYWVTNLTLSYREILQGLDVSTSIFNLFDEDYSDPGSTEHVQELIPGAGLLWRLQLTYHLPE